MSKRDYFCDCNHGRKEGPPIFKSVKYHVSEVLASMFVGHLSNDFLESYTDIPGAVVKHCSACE